MPGKIYLVSLNGVPKYVGFTIRPIAVRWKQHIHQARIKKSCPLLQNAINKYGPEAFTITEIYSSEDIDHTLNVMEPHFIREHNTHVDDGGYNLSVGGEKGWLGRKHTQETKQKMRLAHLGKKKPNVIRKPHSEETKQKIRLAHLGKSRGPHSEETKEKIRKSAAERARIMFPKKVMQKINTVKPRKKCSEETKVKISKANSGRIPSQETREKMRLAKLGRKTKPCSEETKEKIRQVYFKRQLTTSLSNPSRPIRSSHTPTQGTQSSSLAPAE